MRHAASATRRSWLGREAQVEPTYTVTLDPELWLPDGNQFAFGRSTDEPVADFLPGFSRGVVG